MTKAVVTIHPTASFKDVVECMLTAGVSGLPVLDGDDRLLGIVSETDVMSRGAYPTASRRPRFLSAAFFLPEHSRWQRKATARTARELMTAQPVTVSAADQVSIAALRMLERGVNRLPVVDDDGRLVGIVTRSDVMRAWAKPDEALRSDIDEVLGDILSVPEDHHVVCDVEDGIVRMTGTVRMESDEVVVEAAVRHVPGVVDVVNEVVAEHPTPSVRDFVGRPR